MNNEMSLNHNIDNLIILYSNRKGENMAISRSWRMAWMALPLIFLLGPVAGATLLMEENFSYSAGQLTAAGGGANVSGGNWVTSSGTGNYIQVIGQNLSFSGYPSSGIGNCIAIVSATTSAEDAYRQFAAQGSGTTTYVGFLLNLSDVNGLGPNSSTTGDYFLSLLPSSSTTAYVGRISVRLGSTAGTFNLGLRATSSNTEAVWIPTDLVPGTTYLVVLGYQLGPDQCWLWLNPSLSGAQPAADLSQTPTGTVADIGRVAVRQNYASPVATPNATIDGFRVGTEWNDINGLNPSGPNVQNVSPASGASSVLPDANISVTFDRLVNGATVDTSSFVVTGRRQAYYPADSIRPAGNSASYTYFVRDTLRKSDTVTVTLTTAIADTGGNNMVVNYSWTFYTLIPDFDPPIVVSTSPANGQDYIPVDAQVEINFNEAMLPSTVTAASFSVTGRKTAQYQIGTPVMSNGDRRITIQPVGGFQYKDTVTVRMLPVLTDLSGNALRDTSIGFSTKLRAGVTIRDIQYTTDPSGNSPYSGQSVTVSGVVTGVIRASYSKGSYFIQDGTGPWNGIYCYDNGRSPSEGDSVLITGEISEYHTLTELSPTSFTLLKRGAILPEPVILPTCSLSSSNPNIEALEGILVATNKVTVATTANANFEWTINDGSGPAAVDDALDSLSKLGYNPIVNDSLARVQGIIYYGDSYTNYYWRIEPRFTKDIVQFKPVRFLSSMPANGKANVPSQVGIRLEFDKPLDPATVVPANFAVTGSLGGSYPLTVSYDNLNYLVTLKAQPSLTPGETVSVWVSYALRDTFGWYLDGNRDGVGSNDTTDQVRFGFTTLQNPTRIADVQRTGPDGFTPLLLNQTVTVEGVVTGPANIISSSTSSTASSYIQDVSGGVNLYGGSKSDFDLGRRVVATGTVTEYNGVTEVAVSSSANISVWDLADSLPRPKTMIYNQFPTESIEGLLIDFEGTVNAPPAYAGGGYNLEVRNGDAVVALRYGETSGFDNSVLTSGVKVRVTGIVSQYDKEPPYSTGYQIVPRFPASYIYNGRTYPADIELIADLTPPSASPEISGIRPNPFSPDLGEAAWIELNAPADDRVTLRLYDLKGRLVKTCLNNAPGGHQTYPWDGKDNMGRRANIGIYIAHLRSLSPQGGSMDRTKLVVLGTPLK
jgi:hypothetical protein